MFQVGFNSLRQSQFAAPGWVLGHKHGHPSSSEMPLPATQNRARFGQASLGAKPWFPGQGQIRFGGIVQRDYGVVLGHEIPINTFSVFFTLREMMFRDQKKSAEGDPSSLKLFLDAGEEQEYSFTNQSALADNLVFFKRPVDVIVKSMSDVAGLKTLLSATGKRFMNPGAELYMGTVTAFKPDGNSEQGRALIRFYKDFVEDLVSLITLRTGETNTKKINKDINNAKPLNALQALWYGQKGLVDAVLLKGDRVLTRDDLAAYYQDKRMTPDDIEQFNQHRDNLHLVPTRLTLAEFSPESVPSGKRNHYKSLGTAWSQQEKARLTKPGETAQAEDPGKPAFYFKSMGYFGGVERKEDIPTRVDIGDSLVMVNHFQVANAAQTAAPSVLNRDSIYFALPFIPTTMRQIREALIALDEKKAGERADGHTPSNISLVVNSPGGYINTARELKDTIQDLDTKVDVITQGMAASCGALLLSSATGNRLATPNARILIHQASTGGGYETSVAQMENEADSLDQATLDCARIIGNATGKKPEEVHEDMRRVDVWFTPLEALFYGPKGLIDGVLVGADKVITREKAREYLQTTSGLTGDDLDDYIERKISEKLDPELTRRKKTNGGEGPADPFENPLRTLLDMAATHAQPMASLPQFQASLPAAGTKNIDYFHISPTSTAGNISISNRAVGARIGPFVLAPNVRRQQMRGLLPVAHADSEPGWPRQGRLNNLGSS